MTSGPVHPATAAATQVAQWPALVDGLTDAIASEKRLIDELIAAMRRQRQAVAADDLAGVDDSVFAVQRILLTLGEARKRRRTLNARLGQPEETSLGDLLEILGPHATDELRQGRRDLQSAAAILSREVAVNRQVLREALAAGDDVVRALAGAVTPRVGYGDEARGSQAPATPFLVNRRG
jgi:hypothetical protein